LLGSWPHAIASAQQLCLVQVLHAVSPGAMGHIPPDEEPWGAPPVPVPVAPPEPKMIAPLPPQAPVTALLAPSARAKKPSTTFCCMSPSGGSAESNPRATRTSCVNIADRRFGLTRRALRKAMTRVHRGDVERASSRSGRVAEENRPPVVVLAAGLRLP
jgi:hypothetical protein